MKIPHTLQNCITHFQHVSNNSPEITQQILQQYPTILSETYDKYCQHSGIVFSLPYCNKFGGAESAFQVERGSPTSLMSWKNCVPRATASSIKIRKPKDSETQVWHNYDAQKKHNEPRSNSKKPHLWDEEWVQLIRDHMPLALDGCSTKWFDHGLHCSQGSTGATAATGGERKSSPPKKGCVC